MFSVVIGGCAAAYLVVGFMYGAILQNKGARSLPLPARSHA